MGDNPNLFDGMPESSSSHEISKEARPSHPETRAIPFYAHSLSPNPMNVPHADPKWWDFKLVHLFIILGMIGSIASNFLAFDRRIGHDENDIAAVSLSVRQVAEQVKILTDQVTRMSREADAASSNTHRIEAVEKSVGDLSPKMERIDTNVDWITKWIQTQEVARKAK